MPSIHQEVTFAAPLAQVYRVLTDGAEFRQMSGGAPAEIQGEGGAFSLFGGAILGRNVELVPNQRLVQAWRVKMWPEGVYTLARFELTAVGNQTRLVFEQEGVPADFHQHIDAGWKQNYWDPMRKHLER